MTQVLWSDIQNALSQSDRGQFEAWIEAGDIDPTEATLARQVVESGNTSIAQLLIEHDAPLCEGGGSGTNLLAMAITNNDLPMADLLLSQGADTASSPTIRRSGNVMHHLALELGHLGTHGFSMMDRLLIAGAGLFEKDTENKRPINCAKQTTSAAFKERMQRYMEFHESFLVVDGAPDCNRIFSEGGYADLPGIWGRTEAILASLKLHGEHLNYDDLATPRIVDGVTVFGDKPQMQAPIVPIILAGKLDEVNAHLKAYGERQFSFEDFITPEGMLTELANDVVKHWGAQILFESNMPSALNKNQLRAMCESFPQEQLATIKNMHQLSAAASRREQIDNRRGM